VISRVSRGERAHLLSFRVLEDGPVMPGLQVLRDGILGERIPAGTEHSSSFVEATRRQRGARRDYDVV
jgi:hypothetical protein